MPEAAWSDEWLLPASLDVSPDGAPSDGVPSYLGLSLREALARARALGTAVEVSGSGYVVRQEPPPGRASAQRDPLRLELRPIGGGEALS
jgi:hypothetical protein